MIGQNKIGYSQQRIQQLAKLANYKILGEISLIDCDADWNLLVDHLKSIKKNQYQSHEKYVVHHQDTEYFLGDMGFSIENFNRVIRHLDLDPCRFVIFTNHRNSTDQWLKYCNHERNQFEVIETPWTKLLCDDRIPDVMPLYSVRYHFCSIMGIGRCHRDKLVHWITANHLEKSNLVIYHKEDSQRNMSSPIEKNITSPRSVSYVTPVPFTRINEEWSNQSCHRGYTESLQTAQIPRKESSMFHAPWYEHVFFDLVAESVFHYPHAWISEKTVRPVINGRPFVMVGAAHSLTWLQEMGFQTFGAWWDESYDLDPDPDSRLNKIFRVVFDICSWSAEQCQTVFQEMIPVLEHNQAVYRKIAF